MFQWLKKDFIGYLDRWEKSVEDRIGFGKTEKNKMMLSAETRSGLRLTGKLIMCEICSSLLFIVHSFVELVEYLFSIPGVSVFLSNRICQDPLENFFGQVRQKGRVNENPNASEFLKTTQALRVVNTTCKTVKGNCRGSRKKKASPQDDLEIENTPLKKRKTKH